MAGGRHDAGGRDGRRSGGHAQAAAVVHLILDKTGLLTPMMASASTTLSAVLFAAAGAIAMGWVTV